MSREIKRAAKVVAHENRTKSATDATYRSLFSRARPFYVEGGGVKIELTRVGAT